MHCRASERGLGCLQSDILTVLCTHTSSLCQLSITRPGSVCRPALPRPLPSTAGHLAWQGLAAGLGASCSSFPGQSDLTSVNQKGFPSFSESAKAWRQGLSAGPSLALYFPLPGASGPTDIHQASAPRSFLVRSRLCTMENKAAPSAVTCFSLLPPGT